MGSIYAQPGATSGSVYAKPGETDGGPAATAPAKGRGFLGSVGHFIADKTERAARDLKGIPGGLLQAAEAPVLDTAAGLKFIATGKGNAEQQAGKHSTALAKGYAKSSVQAVEHPLRDPFQTALTVIPAANTVLRGAEFARGVDVNAPRVLKAGGKETPLIRSRSALGRTAQAGYDRVVQGALDRNEAGQATGRVASRLAAHGQKRIGGALDEESRIQQKMRATPAQLLDQAAVKLAKLPGHRRVQQAALELTSNQTTPEEAVRYHEGQAAKGVNPKQNTAVANLYRRVAKADLVHLDETKPAGERVFINPEHAKLAKADAALAKVQQEGDRVLVDRGVRSEEALATRRNAPGRIRAGAEYEKPTPSKAGVSPALIKATAERDRIAALHQRALDQEQAFLEKQPKAVAETATRTGGQSLPLDNPFRERINNLGSALEVANDRVDRLAKAAQARVKPTGIVGGESARPGRGFVSERVSEKKLSTAEQGSKRGPVVGVTKAPVDAKTYTGRALAQGLRPKDVTGSASRHFRQIMRFQNTEDRVNAAVDTGSDVRRSPRDILVRVDRNAKPISHQVAQALGKETPAVDTADELATEQGLRAAHQAFLDRLLGHGNPETDTARYAIGTKAPDGYKWVDQGALGDLLKPPAGPRGRLARAADNVNSFVTALTVYFKVGHIGTRVLTNAATNIIQGSARPRELGKSADLWEKLTDEQRARALAAAGQHGFSALPHEGTGRIARAASKGAGWWAKHADAPFRFNSLAYELRQAGYSTPEKFNQALDALEQHGHGMPANEWAKVSAAARRADREAISYDRLNDFEKRYLTRAVWFYPWIKGSTLFTVRTAIEHPYKAGVLATAGAKGRQTQEQTLGDTPSYEAGLLALTHGQNPLTTDLSTFSPFATSADVLDAVANRGQFAGFLNPAAGAGGQLAYGLNQYGGASTSPYTDALLSLAAATPEQQLAESYQAQHEDQSKRMFPKTVGGTALRYLIGPATPRRVNRSALAKAAARERSGRR